MTNKTNHSIYQKLLGNLTEEDLVGDITVESLDGLDLSEDLVAMAATSTFICIS